MAERTFTVHIARDPDSDMDILSQTRLEKKDLLRFLVETGHRRFKLKRRDFIIRAFSLSIAIGERLYTNEFQRCREMPSDK